jgi:hypothetical protein
MKQLALDLPFVNPLSAEQEARALVLQTGDRYERTAFRVLALVLARQDMSRVEFAATLGISRQAVHRGFNLLRERGIHDEPFKYQRKDVPVPYVLSPTLSKEIPKKRPYEKPTLTEISNPGGF